MSFDDFRLSKSMKILQSQFNQPDLFIWNGVISFTVYFGAHNVVAL